jgi:hypothetical protein
MGQFFADNSHRLPESLLTKNLKLFLKAAFSGEEIRRLLGKTGEAINPSVNWRNPQDD